VLSWSCVDIACSVIVRYTPNMKAVCTVMREDCAGCYAYWLIVPIYVGYPVGMRG
jgi:hypothetical protein